MANGHGGPRTPAHPAPVSGPGAHSRRTDGGPGHSAQVMSTMPDQPYGQMSADMNAQRTAPMAGATPLPPAAPVPQGQPQQDQQPQSAPPYQGGDFSAPSGRPAEHVMTGTEPGALQLPVQGGESQPSGQLTSTLRNLSASDTTGTLAQLYLMAQERGV